MEKIHLGKIVNVRGLKGEVKISSTSSFSKIRYKKNNEIIVSFNNEEKILTVDKHSKVGNFDYVIFNEINNVDDANKLRDYDVYTTVDRLHSLNKDEYYFYQLLDCKVYDQNSNFLGKVVDIESNTVQEMLRVKDDKNSFLVPFVKAFIIDVDVDNKKIIINKMEGLI